MKAPEHLQEINALKDRALDLAGQVGSRLEAGTPPTELVQLLREQAATIGQFRDRFADFQREVPRETRAHFRTEIERLKTSFDSLVGASEANYKLASQKGVRVGGIGGKPHPRG
ncbi:MAG: hypothetical protein QGI83_04475 [Candidatus Latescibacteria bacterium]|nr:hypothetical protein [Candidatus Latescibacterota bacterium]